MRQFSPVPWNTSRQEMLRCWHSLINRNFKDQHSAVRVGTLCLNNAHVSYAHDSTIEVLYFDASFTSFCFFI